MRASSQAVEKDEQNFTPLLQIVWLFMIAIKQPLHLDEGENNIK